MKQKLNCIMFIDDDEPTNFLSSLIIEEANCTKHLQIEDTCENAINYLRNCMKLSESDEALPWPDLIFLDINMPAMNGWEFLDNYKELPKANREKVIIIMLTTSLDPYDKIKALNMPIVSDFDIKPLTPELLAKVISKYFTSSDHLHHMKNPV